MSGEPGGNGRVHEADLDETLGDALDDDALDDDTPLTDDEATGASAIAAAETDETLDERVEAVIEELDGVVRVREGESVRYLAGDQAFAVLMEDVLEVLLDPVVSGAALKTPDTMPSSRGRGWIAFTPEAIDRFALDRAEAWLRSAHRRATG